jgi:NhaP-type Na+/H+ or K+/H+ antiporter
MNFKNEKTKQIILTATLSIVLFTLTVLGGATMPVLKILDEYWPDEELAATSSTINHRRTKRRRRRTASDEYKRSILLSKTQEMVTVYGR